VDISHTVQDEFGSKSTVSQHWLTGTKKEDSPSAWHASKMQSL